jgi:Fe-S-cluster containining protein
MKITSNIKNFGVNEDVTDYNNPNCDNCNDCCTMMAILKEDEYNQLLDLISCDKKIKKYTLDKIIEYRDSLFKNNTLNWMCFLSNNDKKCMIYEHRPDICKKFHCDSTLNEKYDVKEYPKQSTIMVDVFLTFAKVILTDDEFDKMIVAYKLSYEQYIKM